MQRFSAKSRPLEVRRKGSRHSLGIWVDGSQTGSGHYGVERISGPSGIRTSILQVVQSVARTQLNYLYVFYFKPVHCALNVTAFKVNPDLLSSYAMSTGEYLPPVSKDRSALQCQAVQEYEGNTILRNVDNYLPVDTVLHPQKT